MIMISGGRTGIWISFTELTSEKEKIEAENPGNKVNGKPEVENKPELEEKPEEKNIKSPEEDEREKESWKFNIK